MVVVLQINIGRVELVMHCKGLALACLVVVEVVKPVMVPILRQVLVNLRPLIWGEARPQGL